MKKINLLLLMLCSLLFFTSCEDRTEIKTDDLLGMWINKTDATDTIVFINAWSEPAFEVKRGKELSGDFEVPKIGSGPYWYKIKKDTIYVNYGLSSYGCHIPYHITINKEKNEFSVNGNFTYYPSDEMYFTYKK